MLSLRQLKWIISLVVGITLLLIGIALLFLPGPGILIIFLGIVVLAGEFLWARRILRRLKRTFKK